MARVRKRKAPKGTEDIFSPTQPGGRPQQGRRPGRPPLHDEAWTRVTVVLFNRQIVFLDRLAANIRAQSGAAISRAQLIRALLDAVADADVDLTRCTSRTQRHRRRVCDDVDLGNAFEGDHARAPGQISNVGGCDPLREAPLSRWSLRLTRRERRSERSQTLAGG